MTNIDQELVKVGKKIDSFLLSNLNEKYTKLQKDLFDAEKLNVNKNDLIDNFLTSFNF